MDRVIIADINMHEARIALVENGDLAELQIERHERERLVGNIYKGKVANVLPGMQAAFVDIGLNKNAFLYAGDILADKSDFIFEKVPEDVEKDLTKTNIRDMVREGQDIMVQVLKQPGGNKGARVTTHITLPGRSLVLMPTVNHVGVSRKIENEVERERLKNLLERIKPEGMGVIVRTAGEGKVESDFADEIRFLKRLWEKIKEKADILTAPRLIHAEETLVFRTVRDMFTEEVSRFIINDQDYYNKVLAVSNIIAPYMKDRIEFFEKHYNIFEFFGIESKIDKILNRKVWLKLGGYLIFDETEALTVIDVNTGKYVGEDDLQDTILNTNIEAANEIARQLRLRDISGIIIIDFIDMEKEENREKVLETLRNALKNDRTKTNVLGITGLGLVEMTRKKVRRKLSTLVKKECPYCNGFSMIDSEETVALRIRREVVRQVHETSFNEFLVEAHPDVAAFIVKKGETEYPILPTEKGKKYYLKSVKTMHREEIKVTGIADNKKREEAARDALVFC
jgi:ribonuclease G